MFKNHYRPPPPSSTTTTLANLYDRIHLHFVVDFLELHILHYHWPDFNLADSAIVLGACLRLLESLRPSKPNRA